MTKLLFCGMGQSNAVEGADKSTLARGTYQLAAIYAPVAQRMHLGNAADHPTWQDYGPESLQPKFQIGTPAGPRNFIGHSITIGRALGQALGSGNVVDARVACSGTGITAWLPGAAPLPGDVDNLYTTAMTYLAAYLAAEGAVLGGIWWTQGNADAGTQANADAYGARLGTLFAALRASVGIPTLRIVYDQLPPAVVAPYTDVVRAQQAAYAPTDPYCRMIATDASFTLRDDDHYTADSFMRLGWLMADAFLDRLKPAALLGEPPG